MMKYIGVLSVLLLFFFTMAYAENDINKILDVRKQFKVEVLRYNCKQEFGTSFPYSDYVRLRVTNKSKTILSCLTVMTYRYDKSGKLVGSSRAPSIPTYNLKPGESAEFDYYPRGHLSGVTKIAVEVEKMISPDSLQFIDEVSGNCK